MTNDFNRLKPKKSSAKTSMDGRVVYENIDVLNIKGDDMRRIGELFAKEFPDYTIWVTSGSSKRYDVRYSIDKEHKIISLDFYCVRPGFSYLKEIIKELRKIISGEDISDRLTVVGNEFGTYRIG